MIYEFIIWSFPLQGAGTDDDTLMRIVVSRCEIDMQNIKAEFSSAYGQTVGKFIAVSSSKFLYQQICDSIL